jgi:hypothetical protein
LATVCGTALLGLDPPPIETRLLVDEDVLDEEPEDDLVAELAPIGPDCAGAVYTGAGA